MYFDLKAADLRMLKKEKKKTMKIKGKNWSSYV